MNSIDEEQLVEQMMARQANAMIGRGLKFKGQLRIAHVHHDLDRDIGHLADVHGGDLGLQEPFVDLAGVALKQATLRPHGNGIQQSGQECD